MVKYKVLIADDEEDIRDFLISSVYKCQIMTASNGEEAISILEKENPDLIFCDYNMPKKTGGDVYQYILNTNSCTKYVLCSADDPSLHQDLNDRRLFYFQIEKPHLKKGVKDLFDKLKSLNEIPEELPTEIYTPISTRLLIQFDKLPANIYIRLTQENFIKIFDEGSIFDETDYIKYTEKNIYVLYAKNLGVERIANQIEKRISDIITNSSHESKLAANIQVQNIIVSLIKDFGLHPAIVPTVMAHFKNSLSVCTDNRATLMLRKLLRIKDTYIAKHSFLLSFVSTALAEKSGWPSSATVQKLIFSSLFHDIFLKDDIENELLIIASRKMSEDFLSHPERAAELLDKIPSIPPDTGRIILEQHEIGPEQGIPKAMAVNKASPLGQLFSFSHIIVDIMLEDHAIGEDRREIILEKLNPYAESSPHYRKFFQMLKEMDLF